MALLTGFEQTALYTVVGVAVAALIYALVLRRQVLKENAGSGKIVEVWEGIKNGANAYLKTQFKSLIIFVGLLGIFLYFSSALVNPPLPFLVAIGRVGAFVVGAFFSAMVGYIGMNKKSPSQSTFHSLSPMPRICQYAMNA